jgi:uncharacterized protein (DUF3084 family)
MEKLARTMQIRFGGILRNAQQNGHFVNSCVQQVVQSQSRLVDLRERLNTLGKRPIALRLFRLPGRPRPRSHCAIKNRVIGVGFGSEPSLSSSLPG